MTPNISKTVRNFTERFSSKVGTFRGLQNPPTQPGLRVPVWGSGAPNQFFFYANLQKICTIKFVFTIFFTRGYEDLAIKGLNRKSDVGNNMKWGLKVDGGVALFRDPPLPVPLDALFMAHVLEVGELIKTLFEWCRYLLPVWSYGGLNFSKAL